MTDHLGSVRQLVSTSGQVQAQYQYDPYGNQTKVSGATDADMGFAGLFKHRPTGLDFAVYRAYDSQRGRWLNRDPIEEAGGFNLYAYVESNPLNERDNLGLFKTIDPISSIPSWIPGYSTPCHATEVGITGACHLTTWNKASRINSLTYHRGYTVYKEAKSVEHWGSECAYDSNGKLVSPGQSGAGTADYWPDWTIGHFKYDPGGPRLDPGAYKDYWKSHAPPPGTE